MTTERIPVLVTAEDKKRYKALAEAAGLPVGEFMRRAADAFRPDDDEALLAGMIEQMEKTTAQAGAAIDEALSYVEASNRRIAAMEARANGKRVA